MSRPLKLHDYQEHAVAFLQNRKRAALLLDMGLGKTASSLSALAPAMLPALVTAPKRVAENVWETEAAKWRPDLTVAVARGTPAKRLEALNSSADIVVIGRDNLADAVPYARHFNTFIIDELSGFKSRASTRWKNARKITKEVDNVWGLTGTPAPNGLMDMWAQMFLIDKGESLGTSITGFRARYYTEGWRMPNGVVTKWEIRPEAVAHIHRLLEISCLSMTTEGRIELPPVTYNDVLVPMSPQVQRLYRSMKDDLVADARFLGGEIHSASNAGVLTGKLSQIASGALYVDDADLRGRKFTVIHREKVQALKEIVEGTGSPVLVAYQYQSELELLREGLGDIAHTIDEPNIVARWNRGQVPVLLAHPDSAGHGLNLQEGGHTMVWASLPWSLEAYQQMNKRLYRQGQQHPVVIHHLMTPKTTDYAKMQVLTEKASVQDAVMYHLESPL